MAKRTKRTTTQRTEQEWRDIALDEIIDVFWDADAQDWRDISSGADTLAELTMILDSVVPRRPKGATS